mmetsp:Transcript_70689/g.206981  ORF Transcript_70689/g.206981 Transcript_70689/m.206981 type:complete len:390 (-) Transcript_70689:159-1328(-)
MTFCRQHLMPKRREEDDQPAAHRVDSHGLSTSRHPVDMHVRVRVDLQSPTITLSVPVRWVGIEDGSQLPWIHAPLQVFVVPVVSVSDVPRTRRIRCRHGARRHRQHRALARRVCGLRGVRRVACFRALSMVSRQGRIEDVRKALEEGDCIRDLRGAVVKHGPQLVRPKDAVAPLAQGLLVRLVELADLVQLLHLPYEPAGAPGQRVRDRGVALAQQPPHQEAALPGVAAPAQHKRSGRVTGVQRRWPTELKEAVGRAPRGEHGLLEVHGHALALPVAHVLGVPLLVVGLRAGKVPETDVPLVLLHPADRLRVRLSDVEGRRRAASWKWLQDRTWPQALYDPLLSIPTCISQLQPVDDQTRRALVCLDVLDRQNLADAMNSNPIRLEVWR